MIVENEDNKNDNDDEMSSDFVLIDDAPGTPVVVEITETEVTLAWKKPSLKTEAIENYEIRFRSRGAENWSKEKTKGDQTNITLENLNHQTAYVFQVRACYKNGESDFSLESQEYTTEESKVKRMLESTTRENNLTIRYLLPVETVQENVNDKFRTQKIGKSKSIHVLKISIHYLTMCFQNENSFILFSRCPVQPLIFTYL